MAYNIKELKAGGIMKQKEKDLFSLRLRVVGGKVAAEQLPVLAGIAGKYGRGHIHLTARQGIEIPYIRFADIETVKEELKKAGLMLGACGPRIRTVTACQGSLCSHGLIDTLDLAAKLDERYYGQSGLPHKFKIGVTGCPNNCIKPYENDLGIMGIVEKEFIQELCNLCDVCIEACPVEGALRKENDTLIYDASRCIRCGECIFSCPLDAWKTAAAGYAVFVGGKMGKWPKLGVRLDGMIKGDDAVLRAVDGALEFYRREGKKGERFGDTIDRVGLKTLTDSMALSRPDYVGFPGSETH